jgi:hypothetical protein
VTSVNVARVSGRPMPDDGPTVPVSFELDTEIATALKDPAMRARVERLIRRTVRPAVLSMQPQKFSEVSSCK